MVMQRLPAIFAAMLLTLIWVSGCARTASEDSLATATADNFAVWLGEGLEFEGMTIAFGHRDRPVTAGDWLEPIVAITKDGTPVADAMVFYQLVSSDGLSTLGDEVATVYDAASGGKPACYAGGKLRLPDEVRDVAVRVRIVLPEINKEWSRVFLVVPASDSTISYGVNSLSRDARTC